MAQTYTLKYTTSNDWSSEVKPSLRINEGDIINWGLITSGIPIGQKIYWKIEGNGIDSTDYMYESEKGRREESTLYRSSGSIGFDSDTSFKINQDFVTEGDEYFTIKAYKDSGRTQLVASSPIILISDTSKGLSVVHTITTAQTKPNEGETVSITINSPVNGNADYSWYALGGGWDRTDFSSIKVNGYEVINSVQFSSTGFSDKVKINSKSQYVNGTLDSQGRAVIELTIANDVRKDGEKNFLFGASFLGAGNERPNVIVGDSSTGPIYTIKTPYLVVNEGSRAEFNVETREVQDNTEVNWIIEGPRIPWYLKDTINSSDISDGNLSGQGIIKNGIFTKSIEIKTDRVTEGDEQLVFKLFSKDWNRELASNTITIADRSKNPYYNVLTSSNSITEGGRLTTNVETNLSEGSILYWSVFGSNVDATDFSEGGLTDQSTVDIDGKLAFTHTLARDWKTEGNETLAIKVFSDSARTQQVGTTSFVEVTDTSIAASISSSNNQINEGGNITTTVSIPNVNQGTILYWSVSGDRKYTQGNYVYSIDAADFSAGELTGQGTVSNDGKISFTHTLANDTKEEGDENLYIKVFSDASLTKQIGTSSLIVVKDTSAPIKSIESFIYASSHVSNNKNYGPVDYVNEGDVIQFKSIAKNIPESTIIYWSISGENIQGEDFTEAWGEANRGEKGYAVVGNYDFDGFNYTNLYFAGDPDAYGPYGASNARKAITNDFRTEGDETLDLRFFADRNRTQQIGITKSFVIKDTSTTPAPTYTLTPSSATINEGAVLTSTVATTNLASGTTLYYSLTGTGISTSDFSSGALTGAGSVGNDGKLSFRHTLANDLTTEGSETLNIKLFSDSSRSTQVATTASVSILDTSIKPVQLIFNGTKNKDTLVGNSANNVFKGLGSADILTGMGGADTFKYALSDSRLTGFDHITDFAIGTDIIDGPSTVSSLNLKELGTVSSLTQVDISAVLTSANFVRRGAATFSLGGGSSSRTFLALNDSRAGFQSTYDAIIEITGFSGRLTDLAIK